MELVISILPGRAEALRGGVGRWYTTSYCKEALRGGVGRWYTTSYWKEALRGGVGRWYTTWHSKEALRGDVELVGGILPGSVKRH